MKRSRTEESYFLLTPVGSEVCPNVSAWLASGFRFLTRGDVLEIVDVLSDPVLPVGRIRLMIIHFFLFYCRGGNVNHILVAQILLTVEKGNM